MTTTILYYDNNNIILCMCMHAKHGSHGYLQGIDLEVMKYIIHAIVTGFAKQYLCY